MNRVRRARFERGMTATRLAEKARVSRQTIRALETGQVPNAPTAKAVANALDMSMFDLWPLDETDGPDPTTRTAA